MERVNIVRCGHQLCGLQTCKPQILGQNHRITRVSGLRLKGGKEGDTRSCVDQHAFLKTGVTFYRSGSRLKNSNVLELSYKVSLYIIVLLPTDILRQDEYILNL
jgi:hypothetical protein